MKFIVDPQIFASHPGLKIGAIIIRGINNSKRVSAIEGLLRGVSAQRSKEFKDIEPSENPKIDVWYQAYGKFGINPKKYPPSIAALVKRVASGKYLPHVNLLVDLYNYFSLKYLLPIGGEDLDWLCGDLRLTYTKGGEPFRAIGSIEVEEANEGEIAYIDDGGITSRYWNYREGERSKFTAKTVNALILVEDLSKIHMDEFGEILRDMQSNIIKYIGGRIEPYIITEDSNEIDLGVEGRKHVNDAKVPQQEKVHFLVETKKKASGMNKAPKTSSSNIRTELKDQCLIKFQLEELLLEATKKSFPEIKSSIKIEYPSTSEHGDYASNIALQLTKEVRKSPQEIAQGIIDNLPKNNLIEKAEIAGPGFINLFISREKLSEELDKVLREKGEYGTLKSGGGKTIVLDYSAPNIAKPLGIHHLLSTIIGQSLYNIYAKIGYKSISINHIGDWGTQFGKLIYAYKNWGDRATIEKEPINELLKLYVKFHDEAEKDASIEDKAREEFKKFEEGDKENHELWQWFVDESMKEINKTYEKIGGIHFDYTHGESFYENKMSPILEDGKKKGIFKEGSEGAFVVEFEDPNIPVVPVQKKDGTTLYITRDFATLKYRLETFKPEKILYVVDIAQTMHFKQLFEAAKKLGWYQGEAVHVWFGRMHMKDGTMSTRKGTVIRLEEVLDEAIKRALKIVEEKSPHLIDKQKVAEVVGIGAVKYNILSQNRTTDITFDWDKMLSLEGNSAPYLQYSYARARSILRKKDISEEPIKDSDDTASKIEELLRILPKYGEHILLAAQDYKPNILANYLYELAQKFNSFYNTVSVLRAEKEKDLRLKLVEATAEILKNGLKLLGVEVVEEM